MDNKVYVWVHEYEDTEGNVQYTIAASPTYPTPDELGNRLVTGIKEYDMSELEYLAVDPTTKQIIDLRDSESFLDEKKNELLDNLKEQTYNYITKYMPLWRQNSWSEFVRCYDKMQTMSLTKAEQLTITEMTNKFKLSPSEVYSRCQKALEWIIQCKLADEAMEEKINACFKWDDLKQIDITQTEYPAWPLDEEE